MKSLLTCLLLLCILPIFSQVNLEDGLVMYYTFDDHFADESSNELQVVSSNPPQFSTNYKGQKFTACRFNGDMHYLQIKDTDVLDFNSNDDFTFSILIKAASNQVETSGVVNDILSKWNGQTSIPYAYAIRIHNQTNNNPGVIWAGRFDATCGNHPTMTSTTSLFDDQWHHVVFQKDGDELKLYIDCNLEATVTDIISCNTTNNLDFTIGNRIVNTTLDSRAFTGGMDELRVYNRALNVEELDSLCNFSISALNNIDKNEIVIFPNPISGKDRLNIMNLDKELIKSIDLYSVDGKKFEIELDTMTLPYQITSGVYFCIINTYDNQKVVKRIVVKTVRA